jgi:hypothetical protein
MVFVMNSDILDFVKQNFFPIYQELENVGIRKFKKHKIKAYKFIKEIYNWLIDMRKEN